MLPALFYTIHIILFSVSPKYILCINFPLHIIPVGNDYLALFLEYLQVFDHAATEESTSILYFQLVHAHFCSLRPAALFHTLNLLLFDFMIRQ